jgi:hypothetical protein
MTGAPLEHRAAWFERRQIGSRSEATANRSPARISENRSVSADSTSLRVHFVGTSEPLRSHFGATSEPLFFEEAAELMLDRENPWLAATST